MAQNNIENVHYYIRAIRGNRSETGDIIKNLIAQSSEVILTDESQFEKASLGTSVMYFNNDQMGLVFFQVESVNAGDKLVVMVYF